METVLSDFELTRINKVLARFCEHCSERLEQLVSYRVFATEILLTIETVNYFGQPVSRKIARLAKDPDNDVWSLYCADRAGQWYLYQPPAFNRDFEKLLAVVADDQNGVFFQNHISK